MGAVCSGSMLFASILNLSDMLGNYLQQTTSATDIFRCILFLGTLRIKVYVIIYRIHGDFFQQASFEIFHTCTVIYYQQIHVIIHRDIAIVLYHNLLLYFHCQFPVHL